MESQINDEASKIIDDYKIDKDASAIQSRIAVTIFITMCVMAYIEIVNAVLYLEGFGFIYNAILVVLLIVGIVLLIYSKFFSQDIKRDEDKVWLDFFDKHSATPPGK
ncbi:MAG: hypothetical protein ACFNZO_02900 [Candidatus Saccharibacteria bacterium]